MKHCKLILIEEDEIQDTEIETYLNGRNISVYNLFKCLEQILIEYGYCEDDINEYYHEILNSNLLN